MSAGNCQLVLLQPMNKAGLAALPQQLHVLLGSAGTWSCDEYILRRDYEPGAAMYQALTEVIRQRYQAQGWELEQLCSPFSANQEEESNIIDPHQVHFILAHHSKTFAW